MPLLRAAVLSVFVMICLSTASAEKRVAIDDDGSPSGCNKTQNITIGSHDANDYVIWHNASTTHSYTIDFQGHQQSNGTPCFTAHVNGSSLDGFELKPGEDSPKCFVHEVTSKVTHKYHIKRDGQRCTLGSPAVVVTDGVLLHNEKEGEEKHEKDTKSESSGAPTMASVAPSNASSRSHTSSRNKSAEIVEVDNVCDANPENVHVSHDERKGQYITWTTKNKAYGYELVFDKFNSPCYTKDTAGNYDHQVTIYVPPNNKPSRKCYAHPDNTNVDVPYVYHIYREDTLGNVERNECSHSPAVVVDDGRKPDSDGKRPKGTADAKPKSKAVSSHPVTKK